MITLYNEINKLKIINAKSFIIILFVFLCTMQSKAQYWGQRKYEFYYGIGASNFMADAGARKNSQIWMHFFNTIGIVGNTGLKYSFAKRHMASANLSFGQLYAADVANNPNFWYVNGRQAKSYFAQLTARYEFVLVPERRKRTVYRQLGETRLKNLNIPTYIFVGAGGMFNAGNFSMVIDDGKSRMTESYHNVTGVIPFGFGFKYRLSPYVLLNLELTQNWTLSDKLDNVTPDQYGGGQWIDQYQFVTFNVIYKLRSNLNGCPRFKLR